MKSPINWQFTAAEFHLMCRELRDNVRVDLGKGRGAQRLKQREVASSIGVATSTYGNTESNKHKTIARERAAAIAALFQLDDVSTRNLLAAWEAQPIAAFTQAQRDSWAKRNERRGKLRQHPKLLVALLEVVTLYIAREDNPCTCPPYDVFSDEKHPPCEICNALQQLGLEGWGNKDVVMQKLADLQEGMSK